MTGADIEATAYSIDGRTFTFQGPVATGIRPGAYVSLDIIDGTTLIGQILALRATPGQTFGEPLVEGSGNLISRADGEPFTNASLTLAGSTSVSTHVSGAEPTRGTLRIGTLTDVPDVPAVLHAEGFGRHTFVCGQSGSGKTYTLGLILERILHDTSLRVVILDQNSDYVRIGSMLRQPETGLNDHLYQQTRDRHDEIQRQIQVFGTDANRLYLWLGNLTLRQRTTILGLDPIADGEEVEVALRIMDGFGTGRFSPGDIRRRADAIDEPAARQLALRIGNQRLEQMGIWADEHHHALVDRLSDDWRALVFDVGSMATPTERSIVSAAAVAALWELRNEREPVLVVIDEAHNVCPQDPTDRNQALATEHVIAMAGEGRKYGIFLILATQRPTKIHENVLSQCDNLILMRMNSDHDIAHLTSAFSAVPPALIRRWATFGLGEGLTYGRIASNPLLFSTGRRFTPEGGSDLPADWAQPVS